MVIPELIIHERIKLNETQEQIAIRFGVNANTVSRWESEVNEAPYKVITFVLGEMFLYIPQMEMPSRKLAHIIVCV